VPRPPTWLPRLAEIRRSVKNSVRSHYERKDIERLFELQPRAAQALVQGISPSAKVGRSFLVARADLEAFLDRINDRIHEGAHPASLLSPRSSLGRSEPVPRRRLRELVQVDRVPATLDTAPGNISFQPGELAIGFRSMQELAGALLALAEILDNREQFALFEDRYVPRPSEANHSAEDGAAVQKMFKELEGAERECRENHSSRMDYRTLRSAVARRLAK
jgi:hypothetical protein